jgi:hypothetical protein
MTRGAKVEVICANKRCRVKFMARVADRKRGWGRFCSKSCKAAEQECRTHQHANHLDRSLSWDEEAHETAMADAEAGWDGHKF